MTTVAATVTGAGTANASPPPVPALERPDLVAARALIYLCLASLWIAGVGVAAAAFVDLAWAAGFAYGLGYPVIRALHKLSADAVLFAALLALVVFLLLVRDTLRVVITLVAVLRAGMGMGIRKMPQESKWGTNMLRLRDTAVIAWLASLPFALLSVVGCVVMIVLSPADGSLTGMICRVVFDVGAAGSMLLSCFVTVPCMALKLWRISPGVEGHPPDDSIV